MPPKDLLKALLGATRDFVQEKEARWDHGDWEDFVAAAHALGFEDTHELRHHLGSLLESARYFYLSGKHVKPTKKKKSRGK